MRIAKTGEFGIKHVIWKYCWCTTYCRTTQRRRETGRRDNNSGYRMYQPSSYSADSLTAPSCHGYSLPCSSSVPCNTYYYFLWFWYLLYGPYWDLAVKCVCGPNFRSTSLQISQVFLATRWGWVFVERTQILSEIQFTRHFIDFLVVETKRFVGSTLNVILTRQTCGQRSSRTAESKRRALEKYSSKRMETEIEVWTTSCVLAKRKRRAMATSERKRVSPAEKIGIWHCALVLFSQVPQQWTVLGT